MVVITGATSGVGRAVAEPFARDGAKIALLARGRGGLEATAWEIERIGGTALPLPTADRYLARTSVSGQQTDEPLDGPRAGTLFDIARRLRSARRLRQSGARPKHRALADDAP